MICPNCRRETGHYAMHAVCPTAVMPSRWALVRELGRLIFALEDDALRVLRNLAARLVRGRAAYGRLTLATDSRDFLEELHQELQDACVYLAILDEQRQNSGVGFSLPAPGTGGGGDGPRPHRS